MPYENIDTAGMTITELFNEAWGLRWSDMERARVFVKEIFERSESSTCEHERMQAHLLRAWLERESGNYAIAAEACEVAVNFFRERQDPVYEMRACGLLGNIHRFLGNPETAARHLERSLEMCRRIGDRREESGVLTIYGNLQRAIGDYDSAIAHMNRALELAEAEGGQVEIASALLALGATYERLGEYELSLEVLRRCRDIADAIGSIRMRSYADGNMSPVYFHMGDVAGALQYEMSSLEAKEQLNDRRGVGISLNNIGLYFTDLGDPLRGFDAWIESLEISQSLHDREGEAIAIYNIGTLYDYLGEETLMLDCYLRSARIAREIGNEISEAYALAHIGKYYGGNNEHARALLYHVKALRTFERRNDVRGWVNSLSSLGTVFEVLGDHAAADGYFSESISLGRSKGDYKGVADTLMFRATALRGRGRYEEAVRDLEESLALTPESGKRRRKVLEELVATCDEAAMESRRSEYRRMLRLETHAEFHTQSARRMRELSARFNGNALEHEGRFLGLDEEDLAMIRSAVAAGARTGKEAGSGIPAAGKTVPLPGTPAVMPSAAGAVVQIRTFGTLEATIGGRVLERSDWSRRRARELFKLLLVHHRTWLTIDDIYDRLWDGRAGRDAGMLVMNAVSHVRKAFGYDAVRTGDGAYMLDLGDDAWIDFLLFKELIVAARGSATAAARHQFYAEAAALYRGDFLHEDAFVEWTSHERQLLCDAFLEALEFLARDHLRRGAADEAAAVARRILTYDAASETAYEVLIRALLARGRHAEVQRTVEECRAAFRRELDADVPERLQVLMGG